MKTQIDIRSGNTQTSTDDTTTQIQIGFNALVVVAVIIAGVILWIVI